MQIVEFNHKTVSALLKKSVAEYWMKDKDAWLKFEDGSVVCIHLLKRSWSAYVVLDKPRGKRNGKSLHDEQSVWQFTYDEDASEPFTSRTVSIDFDNAHYYYHENHYDYTKREYMPVIEFHYYEKGEEIGSINS